MIELGPLRQIYQERCVLDIPGLQLTENGRYALLGVNGSGKSTLLRLALAALTPAYPTGAVACLPQKPYAFAMSVARNIELGIPDHLGLNRSEIQSLVSRQLERLDLTDLAAKRGDRLSGGESQRMALARLLVVPRQVIFLDEPGNHMDLQGLTRLEAILQTYLAETNCLLILATHQISMARRLTGDILFLDQGRLLLHGPAAIVLAEPHHPQLARYLQFVAE